MNMGFNQTVAVLCLGFQQTSICSSEKKLDSERKKCHLSQAKTMFNIFFFNYYFKDYFIDSVIYKEFSCVLIEWQAREFVVENLSFIPCNCFIIL